MNISWKNIENWRSWKMRVFWGGHFEFLSRPFWIFFLLHLIEKCSPFLWGIIFFCTMDGFSTILEKKLSELLCTRLYMNFTTKVFLHPLASFYIPLLWPLLSHFTVSLLQLCYLFLCFVSNNFISLNLEKVSDC